VSLHRLRLRRGQRHLRIAELDGVADARLVPALRETQPIARVDHRLAVRLDDRLGGADRERGLLDVEPHLLALQVELRGELSGDRLGFVYLRSGRAPLEDLPGEGETEGGIPGQIV